MTPWRAGSAARAAGRLRATGRLQRSGHVSSRTAAAARLSAPAALPGARASAQPRHVAAAAAAAPAPGARWARGDWAASGSGTSGTRPARLAPARGRIQAVTRCALGHQQPKRNPEVGQLAGQRPGCCPFLSVMVGKLRPAPRLWESVYLFWLVFSHPLFRYSNSLVRGLPLSRANPSILSRTRH